MAHHTALAMGVTPKMAAPNAAGASCNGQVVVPVQVQDRNIEVDGVDLVVLKCRCLIRDTILIERLSEVGRQWHGSNRGSAPYAACGLGRALYTVLLCMHLLMLTSLQPLLVVKQETSRVCKAEHPKPHCLQFAPSSTAPESQEQQKRRPLIQHFCSLLGASQTLLPATACACLTQLHLTLFMSSSSNSNVRSGRLTRAFHV